MFMLALALLSWEDNDATKWLIERHPYFVITNADTARTILGALIGGIISLTVFSFSMVMVLLNQASSNFSPRLLPGLISDKRNQIVLGIYLGTIIFNIMILMSVLPNDEENILNGFCVLIGIVFGVISLSMFVFFIHTISTGIQINNIIDKIYNQTKKRLNFLIEKERNHTDRIESSEDWNTLHSDQSGYYQGVNLEGLLTFAQKHTMNILIIPVKGQYILNRKPIIKYDQQLDQELEKELAGFLIFSTTNNVEENYVMGIKQITEVAVKAMSPGINDPGTAVITIDYLTELLSMRMQIDESEVYICKDENHKVELQTVDFDDLLYQCLAAYRQYSKHDMIIMEKIVRMFKYLMKQEYANEAYPEILSRQLQVLKADIQSCIENQFDKEKLLTLIDKV
jgi:uncharacterized membrane protein